MPEPTPVGLVPCKGCRDVLVLPGQTCFACRREPRPSPGREKRQRKVGGLVMPAKPRLADIATARRLQGDGRRWR